jgi:hypothetical protein
VPHCTSLKGMKTYKFFAVLPLVIIFANAGAISATSADAVLTTEPGTVAEVVPDVAPEPANGIAPHDMLVTEPGSVAGTAPGVDPVPANGVSPHDMITTEPGTIGGVVPEVTPQPVIQVIQTSRGTTGAGKIVELSWPDQAAGLVLETTDDLRSGHWTPVLQAPVSESGKKKLLLPTGNSTRFFRLR